MFVQSTKLLYSMISSMGCNNGIASLESVIEVIHSNHADCVCERINENTGEFHSCLFLFSHFLFLNVCVRLAQLKVMWVWTHSAFTYCVICGLLSQKGFKFTWMHSVTWDKWDPKSRKISVFSVKCQQKQTRSLLFPTRCLMRLVSTRFPSPSVLHWMVPSAWSPSPWKATHDASESQQPHLQS